MMRHAHIAWGRVGVLLVLGFSQAHTRPSAGWLASEGTETAAVETPARVSVDLFVCCCWPCKIVSHAARSDMLSKSSWPLCVLCLGTPSALGTISVRGTVLAIQSTLGTPRSVSILGMTLAPSALGTDARAAVRVSALDVVRADSAGDGAPSAPT